MKRSCGPQGDGIGPGRIGPIQYPRAEARRISQPFGQQVAHNGGEWGAQTSAGLGLKPEGLKHVGFIFDIDALRLVPSKFKGFGVPIKGVFASPRMTGGGIVIARLQVRRLARSISGVAGGPHGSHRAGAGERVSGRM